MPDKTPLITLIGAVICTAFAVMVTIEVGFGTSAALLIVLAVVFLVVSVVEPGPEIRAWFVRALSWLWRP